MRLYKLNTAFLLVGLGILITPNLGHSQEALTSKEKAELTDFQNSLETNPNDDMEKRVCKTFLANFLEYAKNQKDKSHSVSSVQQRSQILGKETHRLLKSGVTVTTYTRNKSSVIQWFNDIEKDITYIHQIDNQPYNFNNTYIQMGSFEIYPNLENKQTPFIMADMGLFGIFSTINFQEMCNKEKFSVQKHGILYEVTPFKGNELKISFKKQGHSESGYYHYQYGFKPPRDLSLKGWKMKNFPEWSCGTLGDLLDEKCPAPVGN